MFARLFNSSSKDCLQSDDPLTPSQQLREESRRTRSMVTTRGRARELADTPSVNGDSIIIDEGTPVPKRRGRPRKSLPVEDDEVVVTPRPTRSSNKSSVQASDGEDTPKQSPQVIEEIPASAEESEIPQIIEAEEEVIKTLTADGDVSTSSKTTAAVTTPVAKKHKRFDSAEPEPVPEEVIKTLTADEDVSTSSKTTTAVTTPVAKKNKRFDSAEPEPVPEEVIKTLIADEDVSTSSKTTTAVTMPVAEKHKRFDSAEPEPVPEEESEIIETKDDEDESSDDDAPEEVTKNQAADSAKEKEREAAKAIEEQEAAAKKKRQEKNANLQRQSEISSKKRKLDVASGQDEMLPPAQKSKVEVTSAPVTIERGDIEMDEESNTLEGDGTADGRLDSEDIEDINRTFAPPGHLPLPDLLPAEYLEDNDDDDTPESGHLHSSLPARFVKTNKLRHLLEKRPKDKRVGSTTFRVAESRNSHLPPKASNQARSLKESWLQGRAGTKIKPNRKPFNQGFFKPKK